MSPVAVSLIAFIIVIAGASSVHLLEVGVAGLRLRRNSRR